MAQKENDFDRKIFSQPVSRAAAFTALDEEPMAINFPCRGKICLFNLTKRKQFLQLLEETELITKSEYGSRSKCFFVVLLKSKKIRAKVVPPSQPRQAAPYIVDYIESLTEQENANQNRKSQTTHAGFFYLFHQPIRVLGVQQQHFWEPANAVECPRSVTESDYDINAASESGVVKVVEVVPLQGLRRPNITDTDTDVGILRLPPGPAQA
ncbi:conserved hypothetical protein [Culex quinquefasciatus]|uniref:Uncharacterized protein n=1 Tax=Culex quinquefasciatus TaxID=7176 RepID=B0WT28_CULQU|nr:conserved hypothetical protein [Culex quinquefasciatus]|eukprot:XP_001870790.1 conserved hypothetical protein [Culex quinquefasciatus]